MTLKRIAALVAVAAVAIALAPALAAPARAQTAPYSAYGVGLQSGQTVAAFDGSKECGSTTADASGNWLLRISIDAPCAPHDGDTITFTLDGQVTSASISWSAGGAPADVAKGITLTVQATPTPTATPAAGPGTFAGSVSGHGIIPAVWNGGTVAEMVSAGGSGLQSMWVYIGGVATGYTVGAPAFVNSTFLGLFPHNAVPASQIVILVKS